MRSGSSLVERLSDLKILRFRWGSDRALLFPPASITSASPYWIPRKASPIRLGSCCTCSYNVSTFSFCTSLQVNISCCHVCDHFRNKKWINSWRAFFHKLLLIKLCCLKASHTGTDDHAYHVRIFLLHPKACIFHSFQTALLYTGKKAPFF